MPSTNAFSPLPGGTTSLSVTTSSSRVALVGANGNDGVDVRIYNTGSSAARVRFGGATVAASATTDLLIAAGGVEVLGAQRNTNIAAICPTGSTTLEVTSGKGV